MLNKKLSYILSRIHHIKKIKILELGVRKGNSTNLFLKICNKNNGRLISVDIEDCSNLSNDKRWTFIHSRDDNYNLIDTFIKKLDLIFIDSLHEPNHVKKVFYHYYKKLKKNGICIVDDISWLPYTRDAWRDNSFAEEINRSTFQKILEIKEGNKKNFLLEFFFEESGLAIITKKTNNILSPEKKIHDRIFSIKKIFKKIYSPKPKK